MATVKYSTEEEDTRVQVEYQQQGAKSPPQATSPTTSAAAATFVPEHLQVVTVSVADELPAKRHFLGRALNIQNSDCCRRLCHRSLSLLSISVLSCALVLVVDRLLLLFFLSPSWSCAAYCVCFSFFIFFLYCVAFCVFTLSLSFSIYTTRVRCRFLLFCFFFALLYSTLLCVFVFAALAVAGCCFFCIFLFFSHML